jgi:hypothetical protein
MCRIDGCLCGDKPVVIDITYSYKLYLIVQTIKVPHVAVPLRTGTYKSKDNAITGGSLPPIPRAEDGIICGTTKAPATAAADLLTKSLLDDLCDILFSLSKVIIKVSL